MSKHLLGEVVDPGNDPFHRFVEGGLGDGGITHGGGGREGRRDAEPI